ncbi:MAG: hypothetical protein AAFQ27_13715 [Pseudomonadota bacterium]
MISANKLSGLAALAIALSGVAVEAQQSKRLGPEVMERRAVMQSGQLLHDDPALPEYITEAKALGVRTDGLYWSRKGAKPNEAVPQNGRGSVTNHYIRFCEDGSVAGASSLGTPSQVWAWLTCEPVSSKHAHGVLRAEDSVFRFTLHNWPGNIDYEVNLFAGRNAPDASRALTFSITSRVEFAKTFGQTQDHDYWFYALPESE